MRRSVARYWLQGKANGRGGIQMCASAQKPILPFEAPHKKGRNI
jgi:hypothetical protein